MEKKKVKGHVSMTNSQFRRFVMGDKSLIPHLPKMDESVLEKNGANENYLAQKKEEKCHKCEYSFSSKYDLRQHLKIHRGEKTNVCKQCG